MVPNLNITFNSGQPNQAAKINIRGNTSLNGGNALILVDGVEISDLSLVNPQDVGKRFSSERCFRGCCIRSACSFRCDACYY